tara:strand:- start:1890 stop:2108 length:219 start_codon:yes stop_codon:yes gene_type:complete
MNVEIIRDNLYNARQEVNELERLLKIAYKRLRHEEHMNGVLTIKKPWYLWLTDWSLNNISNKLRQYIKYYFL